MKNYTELIKDLEEKINELNKCIELSGLPYSTSLIKLKINNPIEYERISKKNKGISKRVNELREKINVYRICNDIERNNQAYYFIAENISAIDKIINSYRNKRIGVKTYRKMIEEIESLSSDIKNVSVYSEYSKYIIIRLNNEKELYLYPQSQEVWFGSEEEIMLFCNGIKFIDYGYDIETYAEKLIEEQDELRRQQEELREKMDIFNDKVNWTNQLRIRY